jgi:ubiquinone/menaquinone biosynthesis C-methylase UbiE
MPEDFTQRFTGRASVYSTSRPGYPARIIDILWTEIGFDENSFVADIGSGTGLLSILFLQNGNRVVDVEPNDGMRTTAEKTLSKFPRFVSVKGTAEHTGLQDTSIDLVTVGQALHWFDSEAAPREFRRILKTGGHACIVYNDRNNDDSLMKNYDQIVKKYARNRAGVRNIDDGYLARFFRNGKYSRFLLSNEQFLDFHGLLGRMTSASYMPSIEDKEYFALKHDVEDLFNKYEKQGKVRMLYDTRVFLGQV